MAQDSSYTGRTADASAEDAISLDNLLKRIKKYHPDPDLDLVTRAYHFAREHHAGQIRSSGEPYLTHLVAVALLVCKLKLDVPSICAALLHDTIEDCAVSHQLIRAEFGTDIADIVEGVTKITRIEFSSKEEKQAESFRKMLLAMAKDIRVILLKLCDRLHNMRTLKFLSEPKRRAIATETAEIFAPIANRLGIHWLKSELEDLCLLHLRPEVYALIKEDLAKTKDERDGYVEQTRNAILEELEKAGVSATVMGRSKHFYSIAKKMEEQNLTLDEVHDLHGFRLLVPTLRACYESLGVLHARWKPVPGRFKDYIAMPKPNMYQSLHTTVIGPEGQRIEIQIRTPEMHRIAEEGIAAHWRYKESDRLSTNGAGFDLQWVKELVDSQQYLNNPDEFIQSVKGELFPNDVFVFTPRGDLVRLCQGATPLDFAYAVHTDVGHHTIGAKVNKSIVPLAHEVENGDTIEILTSKKAAPSKDWLRFVKSSKAKQRIRAFLKAEEHAKALAVGMEILNKDLKRVQTSLKKLDRDGKIDEVASALGLLNANELYVQLGYGKITSAKIFSKLFPNESRAEPVEEGSPLNRIFQKAATASREKVGVKVSGFGDILVRFARCCEPLPGDRIVGYITRGRGVTVHRGDCSQIHRLDTMRQIDVTWDNELTTQRRVKINVHSQDTIGLLANVTLAITKNGANITSAQVKTMENGKALNSFEISIQDSRQFESLKRAIEQVPGVLRVDRVKMLPGGQS
jgi:GTP pyrophosphokinase